jgi:hypothetical protein
MRESGVRRQVSVMAKELWCGMMVLFMKANGKLTWRMEWDELFMQTEAFMKGNGPMIKQMELECLLILMVLNMKVAL